MDQPLKMWTHTRYYLLCLGFTLNIGCSQLATLDIQTNIRNSLPENWHFTADTENVVVGWASHFTSPELDALLQHALENNQALQQTYYAMVIRETALSQAGAALLPQLTFSLKAGRTHNNRPAGYGNVASASLNLGYEMDIWGKLSAQERRAELDYLAAQETYLQARQQLVADTLTAWFDVVAADQLLVVYRKRVVVAKDNLDIIESGYRQGLNAALDVYLTRNELNTQLARVAQQEVSHSEAVRKLERLLGDYPAGSLIVESRLPELSDVLSLGIPSELIMRKPALRSAWYQLLGRNAALAYAHKQRFPSFNLSAAVSDSTDKVSDLFSPASLAWSLIASMAAPIFDGGTLAANEETARLSLKQQEQNYLETLYNAFANVENGLTRETGLMQRYRATLAAKENAELAEQLSFEQYRSGLVSYTTVLDAQARAFEAQSSEIQLKNQLVANRIQLHMALGGNFEPLAQDKDTSSL